MNRDAISMICQIRINQESNTNQNTNQPPSNTNQTRTGRTPDTNPDPPDREPDAKSESNPNTYPIFSLGESQ